MLNDPANHVVLYSVAHSIICAVIAGLFQRYSLFLDGPFRDIDRISIFETLPKGRVLISALSVGE